jgi:hypothetical protein
MITDKFLRFSDAQAITTTAVSTDKADLLQARDIGEGEDLYAVFTVGTAFAGGTSVNMAIAVADDAALTSNVTTIGMTGPIVTANLTAGAQFTVRIAPLIGSTGKRYLGASYTVVGTYTAGTVTVDIVHGIQDGRKYYPSGTQVL